MAGASSAAVRHVKRLARSEAAKVLVRQYLSINPYAIISSLQMIDRVLLMLARVMDLAKKLQSWAAKFFTCTAVVRGTDELTDNIIDWLSENVMAKQNIRFVKAASVGGISWSGRLFRDDRFIPGLAPEVSYEPTFGTYWFFYHGTIMIVQRESADVSPGKNIEAPPGFEPVLVTPWVAPPPPSRGKYAWQQHPFTEGLRLCYKN